jgi:hypothetical protein
MTPSARNAVIEFPVDRVRPAATREPGAPAGEVVFFTGVRIERMTEEPTEPGRLPGKGRRLRR